MAGRRAIGSGNGHHSFLVGDQGERAEQDSFDPTEHGGSCADAQGQAKNRQKRKARTAAEHPEAEANILPEDFDDGQRVSFAIGLFDLGDAAQAPLRLRTAPRRAACPGGDFRRFPFADENRVRRRCRSR